MTAIEEAIKLANAGSPIPETPNPENLMKATVALPIHKTTLAREILNTDAIQLKDARLTLQRLREEGAGESADAIELMKNFPDLLIPSDSE